MNKCNKAPIIIDAFIDTGGCVETSELTSLDNPTFVKYGIIHYCVPNLSSRYACTTSLSLSNILMPYLLKIGEEGGVENTLKLEMDFIYHGILTDIKASEWFNLPCKPFTFIIFITFFQFQISHDFSA